MAPRNRRRLMRRMQRGWFGKELYFLMVPIYEYLARHGEDVESTALKERKKVCLSFEGEKRGRGDGLVLRRPALKVSIIRNSSAEDNVGRS